MGEERLIILKLLEQGKITESEAEQLLDALGDMEYDQATQEASNTFNPSKVNLSKDKDNTYTKHENRESQSNAGKSRDFEEILESIGKRFETIGEQLEDKMDVFGEQFGKKMVNLGSIFAEKSINFAEKIIDVVDKAVDSDTFINVDLFGSNKCYEEIIEKKLSDIDQVSLQFEAYNGNISIVRWNEPMIKVTAYISAKEGKYDANKPILDLREDGNILCFYPKEIDGIGIKLKIMIPDQTYNLVKAQSKNGSITVENLNCNKLFLQTKNGSITLNHVETKEDTSCTTTNSKIIIENCKAQNLLAATKNGKIVIDNSSIKRIEGLTSNSKITIKDIEYNQLQSLSLKTTNSKIEVIGSLPKNAGVQFDASTTHGNINIGLPVVYVENIKNYSNHRVTARTPAFDTCETIAHIKAYTTNSTIYLF
ncbi:DUF4097 family beta strand repeat protein [Alkaliphilus sp. MSJ-5]|uniref:DUF4097 family beta strand repeat protein n=1 Tax=Alkaliphilus flagellatus TaxID=2841507 RepID=A0ABS6G910_9FIRM|nr:DUF4097 family beta strand repeat-containing protein [Alkaliphilus flagellatus]MBU5678197.1 DUF4097 family beta strand repeat protein [Alkaliphilus flagellatus]